MERIRSERSGLKLFIFNLISVQNFINDENDFKWGLSSESQKNQWPNNHIYIKKKKKNEEKNK